MSHITSLRALALNTCRESRRDRLFVNLLIFGLIMIGSSLLLSALTLGERTRIVLDIGLASMNLFGVLIAIFVGIGLVNREVERRTLYIVLAKPVSRVTFLLGRYLGLLMTLAMNTAIMLLGLVGMLVYAGIQLPPGLFTVTVLIFMELTVVAGVALLCSTFTSTPTLAAIFTLSTWVIGHLTGDLKALGDTLKDPVLSGLLDGVYYLLPNLEDFNLKGRVVHDLPIAGQEVALAVAYGLLYTVLLLLAATMIFNRRDLK